MLVDDDPLFRRALARALASQGCEVVEADGSVVARAQLERDVAIDCAVIDLKLEGDSGLALLAALRVQRPQLRCVLMTGYCTAAIAVDAIRLGAVDCLPKSVSVADLLEAFDGQRRAHPAEVPVPTLAEVEWDHILRVLRDCDGSISLAARKLGIHRQSLQRKLRGRIPGM